MYSLLEVFWYQQKVVPCQKVYHGPHFKSTRGITQVGIILLTLFNLIVDNVVWNWIEMMVEYQLVTQEGLVLAVGRCLGLFYDNGSVVLLRDP